MDCVLCGEAQRKRQPALPYTRPLDHYQMNGIPEPIIPRPAGGDQRDLAPWQGRGPAPGSRAPMLTDAKGGHRPGTPSYGLRQFARKPISMTSDIGPTDDRNRFTRTVAEGGSIRWVREQYVIPGGPAGAAQGLYGNLHNPGYITIADTLKPAQALPQYNYASIDVQSLIDRARAALLKTLYGIGG